MSAPKYTLVHGFKCGPGLVNLEDSLSYEAQADDLFISTYPKCGTTWAQLIVTRILNNGNLPEEFMQIGVDGVSPFLEMCGKQAVIDKKKRHGMHAFAIKLHLPFELSPKHPTAKYIVVMRNAKDTCVSSYHHQKMYQIYGIGDMDFHSFFKFWIAGETEAGDYFDFNLSWWNHRKDPNVLILMYEEMKTDASANIVRIAEFLGQGYADMLTANENQILKQIVQETSFEATKKQLADSGFDGKGGEADFARKGIIGDWRNHFTDEESRIVDQKFHRKWDGTGLEKMWDKYCIFGKGV